MRASDSLLHRSDLRSTLTEQGFVHVPSLGLTPADLAEVRGLLDGLFDRFDSLPRERAADIGGGSAAVPVVPEITATTDLEPRLRRTRAYAVVADLARQLMGPTAMFAFDHAIYKPPGRSAPTSWHQDSAYCDDRAGFAVWVPLQSTDVANGTMRYVPRSHLRGPLPHHRQVSPDGKTVLSIDVPEGEEVDVPCPLGGAIVHDIDTFHGSGPNLGDSTRRAWIVNFVPGRPLARATLRAREFRHRVLPRPTGA